MNQKMNFDSFGTGQFGENPGHNPCHALSRCVEPASSSVKTTNVRCTDVNIFNERTCLTDYLTGKKTVIAKRTAFPHTFLLR
jgi:hypothetical protein